MTKILFAVTCIFCLIAFIGLSDAQTISIPKVEGEAGSTVEASIDIDSNVENVGSIDVTLTYNAELLTATEVVGETISPATGFTVLSNLNEAGKVIIGVITVDGLGKKVAAGAMFKIKLEVNPAAEGGSTSELTLEDMILSDADTFEEIAVKVENGEFTVIGVVNIPPTADAGVAEIAAKVGEEIQLDGSASTDEDGTIATFNWDFGDGEVGEGEKITHAYTEVGEYTVTLTVTDDKGDTGTAEIKVTVTEPENIPPVAVIAGDAEITAKAGETLEFDGSGSTDEDGTIKAYNWDFGDGASDTEAKTSRVYEKAGEFVVTLTVTDDKGDTGTATVKVTVEELLPVIREHAAESPMLAFEGQFPEENISAKCYIDIWTGEFKVESGQYLEYQVAMFSGNPSFNAGIDLHTTDGTLLSATDAKDEAGLSASPKTDLSVAIKEGEQDIKHAARDRWYHRKISLDAVEGKILDGIMLATESETNRIGKIRIYVDNIQITDGENRLLDVYIDNDTILDGKQEATEGECEGIEDSKVLVGVTSIGVQPAGKLPLTWGKIKAAR
ncbi:TPA: PKD domain-containing protein [Candidatus Poribacteria bacterium]|nr:PKD domain-containing protein [Candidatus Poribacteria bacterium]